MTQLKYNKAYLNQSVKFRRHKVRQTNSKSYKVVKKIKKKYKKDKILKNTLKNN